MASRRPRGDADDAPAGVDEGDGAPRAAPAVDGGDDDGGTGDGGPGRRRPVPAWRLLDARTLVICTLVALIAALVAGLVTSRLTDDGSAAGGGEGDPPGDVALVAAESVPDVPLGILGGEGETSLADYRGQPLVVNFWGSWCAPCLEEMPDFQRVHLALGDAVTFIGVNHRDNLDRALEMVEQTGVTYDLVTDDDGELVRRVGVSVAPTTLLVLPDGTIADVIYGPIEAERLCDKINQVLLAGSLQECV